MKDKISPLLGQAPLFLGTFNSRDKVVEIRRALNKKLKGNNEYAYQIFYGENEKEIEEDSITFTEVFGDENEIEVYYTTPTAAVVDIISDTNISILIGKNIKEIEGNKEDDVNLKRETWLVSTHLHYYHFLTFYHIKSSRCFEI